MENTPFTDNELAALGSFPDSLAAELAGLGPELLAFRAAPGTWSINEVLAHLADLESEVYLVRMQSIALEDNPYLPAMDQEEWARERDYLHQNALDNLARFRLGRAATVRFLQELPPESWQRPGVHQEAGPLTLADVAHRLPKHDAGHLEQVRRIKVSLPR